MHLHFERTSLARTDCNVLSLTWMGKVPDELPDDDGWKLNRLSYYQDGWLATGNARGIVGVTFTTCFCRKTNELPLRTNYNLRGHRSEVTLVKWNEPYQKLASCDSSGIIFVWIKYEGRWSIELINDRSTKVTDFCWSHDGRMALICYQDGFVLVGSVAGQRYWSSMLNLEAIITCGIWAPDDQQVLFGTSNGQILVIDVHGAMVAQVSVQEGVTITSMAWSCEKFKMEETDEEADNIITNESVRHHNKHNSNHQPVLAVCFCNGTVYLMKNYDDVSPVVLPTELKGVKMEWSNNGDTLAVAGTLTTVPGTTNKEIINCVQFYTDSGCLRFHGSIPSTLSPVTALTWGHNDKRLFLATGSVIHIGWVTRRVASLQLLARLAIHHCLQEESYVQRLPLPRRLRSFISTLFGQTIKCYLPEPKHLREFVSKAPSNGIRLHCTMIRHNDDLISGSATYTLFLEYLGGLVPLLKGKRASKIRPEFIIFDPEVQNCGAKLGVCLPQLGSSVSPSSSSHNSTRVSPHPPLSSSDSEVEEGCASPRLQRRRRRRHLLSRDPRDCSTDDPLKELVYLDDLPESQKLVAVTSNIWGTKFKLLGLAPWLPQLLGTILYRTSLLHLQPRQMTLVMKELNGPQQQGELPRLSQTNGSSLGVASFSEDEDDLPDPESLTWEECAPVAPMTPKKTPALSSSVQPPPPHHFQPANSSEEDLMDSLDMEVEYARLSPTHDFLPVTQVAFHHQGSSDPLLTSIGTQTSMQSFAEAMKGPPLPHESTNSRPSDAESECDVSPPTSHHKRVCLNEQYECNGRDESLVVNSNSAREMVPRWAEKVGELKYIDEDTEDINAAEVHVVGCPQSSSTSSLFLLGYRSRSVGHLNMTDFQVNREARIGGSFKDQRRLTLRSRHKGSVDMELGSSSDPCENCFQCVPPEEVAHIPNGLHLPSTSLLISHLCPGKSVTSSSEDINSESLDNSRSCDQGCDSTCSSVNDVSQLAPDKPSPHNSYKNLQAIASSSPKPPPKSRRLLKPSIPLITTSRSIPSSPVSKRKESSSSLIRKGLLYSPRLARRSTTRNGRSKLVDSSDEDVSLSGDDNSSAREEFTDLESFQKAYIKKKLKKWRGRAVADCQETMTAASGSNGVCNGATYQEYVLHNKAPLWNEVSQVYQLDFGGRVTQESAKNFQIEFRGKQVMQFGRIDGNAYTLDFQYPFCALQAFAVALANVTQRLK